MANKINASGSEYYLPPFPDHPFWGDEGGTGTVPDITATASVDATTGAPAVDVTQTGDHGENIAFAFSGLKGEKGEKGDIGPAGPEGPQGPKGDDGTSVIPANIVKNVTMDATPDVTMGTTDYDLAYRTNDDQKHNAQTVHLATKQLVLENAQTSAGSSGTDKIGEITLYTIDQSGNAGSQAFGIVAITQTDGSVSLCPALNKDGTWEYGPEFLKIPYVPQNYVKEASVDAPKVENNMKYYPYRQVCVRDGAEQYETTTEIGTFDPEYMMEKVLLDTGKTSESGKYTVNTATFKTRWNHGGIVTEQTDEYTIDSPVPDKNYTDVTMTSATTDSGTTYSLKKTDMTGKEADIGTIEVPKSGGGGSGSETKTYDITTTPIFGYAFSNSIAYFYIPTGIGGASISRTGKIVGTVYNMSGTIRADNVEDSGASTVPRGWIRISVDIQGGQHHEPLLLLPGNSSLITVAPTQAEADMVNAEWKAKYDAEHNRYDVDADIKEEEG